MGRPCVRSTGYWKNSSEVGEKADYPVYQPCKKETHGVYVYSHWLSPLPFVNSTSHHDYPFYHKKISVRSFLSSLLSPSPHFRSYHKHHPQHTEGRPGARRLNTAKPRCEIPLRELPQRDNTRQQRDSRTPVPSPTAHSGVAIEWMHLAVGSGAASANRTDPTMLTPTIGGFRALLQSVDRDADPLKDVLRETGA